MCGLVGIISRKPAIQDLFEMLKSVEYRGYDSHGIAYCLPDGLRVVKKVGPIEKSIASAEELMLECPITCIGHTRWATHGAVNEKNCHPHLSYNGATAIVHNGTITNYKELRTFLLERGIKSRSDTDSEILADLFEIFFDQSNSVTIALRLVLQAIEGEAAVLFISSHAPLEILAIVRKATLLWSKGVDGLYISSDGNSLAMFSDFADRAIDGDIIRFSEVGVFVHNILEDEAEIRREKLGLQKFVSSRTFGSKKFMYSEILEIPKSIDSAVIVCSGIDEGFLKGILEKRLLLTGSGGSFFQAILGKYFLKNIANIPSDVMAADEVLEYCIIDSNTYILALSQSGETFDVVDALRRGHLVGAGSVAIVNSESSTLSSLSAHFIFQASGIELAVPSTKTTVAQAIITYGIALRLARLNGSLSAKSYSEHLVGLEGFGKEVTRFLAKIEAPLKAMAKSLSSTSNILILGRGVYSPIAQEIALKMKEVCYIHAEAVPLGMVKHGALALVEDNTYVLVLASMLNGDFERVEANLEQIHSRGGRIFGLIQGASSTSFNGFNQVIEIPSYDRHLDAIISMISGQMLTYFLGEALGRPIDRPRNLAKSVTVR